MHRFRSVTARASDMSLRIGLAFFVMTERCRAGNVFGPTPDTGGGNGSVEDVGVRIINAILNLIGLIAVVVIVIAGVRLVVGGVDDGQREKARNAVLYAVLGLLLVLFAKAIVQFVVDEFQT